MVNHKLFISGNELTYFWIYILIFRVLSLCEWLLHQVGVQCLKCEFWVMERSQTLEYEGHFHVFHYLKKLNKWSWTLEDCRDYPALTRVVINSLLLAQLLTLAKNEEFAKSFNEKVICFKELWHLKCNFFAQLDRNYVEI